MEARFSHLRDFFQIMKSRDGSAQNFELTEDVVKQAYLYLKSYAYYENLNFFLKQKIAEFEYDSFDENIRDLSYLLNGENFLRSSVFKKWLESIDCYVLPKSISKPEDKNGSDRKNGLFISNVTSSPEYHVDKVNYFINAPVELHIIEVLWCLVVGQLMEKDMDECCYGNRLDDSTRMFTQQKNTRNSQSLFKYYVRQYGSWRDQALKVATEIHKNNEDVALLSLDLKSYFYNVNLDFKEIAGRIETAFEDDDRLCGIALMLTESLERMFSAYRGQMDPFFMSTHPGCEDKVGLPVGFVSSAVLANWYLAEFDKEIVEAARPDYYGRYVDDMIMVFRNPGSDHGTDPPVKSFVRRFLGEQLKEGEPGDEEKDSAPCFYIEVDGNRLPVQQDKLILYLLDREHSRAVLEVFKQELQERSSAFRFLPGEDVERELDRFAYDLLYEGSHNKLRSIVGLMENETELASYLARHIILHRLCKTDRKDSVLPQLERFFRGKNALLFSRLWEKVYQYAVVVRDYDFIRTFYEYSNSEIDKIRVYPESGESEAENLSGKLRENLGLYNKISLGLCVALLDMDLFWPEGETNGAGEKSKGLLPTLVRDEGIGPLAKLFRNANLIRHNLVAWPMANFTGFRGDLTDEGEFRRSHPDMEDSDFDIEKINLSPRFIHFDEWQLFYLQKSLAEKRQRPLLRWQKIFQKRYEEHFFKMPVERSEDGKTSEEMQAMTNGRIAEILNKAFSRKKKDEEKENSEKIRKLGFSVGKKTESSPKKMRIALANIKIKKSDIENAIRKDKEPNISFERQENLYEILNCAVREEADILVLPELSIPASWLPFMVAHCRRHQQAMIFGLEHWNVGGFVYNLLVELLPFKLSEKYRSCFMTARLKNHYAPDELKLIKNLRLNPAADPNSQDCYYNKVNWNGITFASYNCFELSNIEHRTLFKSEIDVLFACVCNRDTNYYQDVLGSAVRDLHCYVVQSNASQYGGSCVLRPMKTENKTMLYVKGGENPSILITEIDVAALRDFQYKPDPGNKYGFKPLPPGFDSEKVLER